MTINSNNCYYLIGDCIEFWPEDNLLCSRINGEKITLFVAASRCLQLLLNQQGTLISQQELFDVGWQKNAMGVSNNTFYQNILMLRKGLKTAGYDQAVIKTVPRQGLTIPSAVPVEIITQGLDTEKIEEKKSKEKNEPVTPGKMKEKKQAHLPQQLWVILFSLSFCASAIMFVVINCSAKTNFFSNFHFIGKIENCSVYLYSNRTSLKSYMQFIAQNNFTCKKHEFVYFTTYPLVPRASAIRCDRPFSSGGKNNCTSEYHLEWQNNE